MVSPGLKDLHAKAPAIARVLGVGKAVPPDLWLIVDDANGKREHLFIEVKLPGDQLSETQVAGLAVIATCLSRDDVPVSVFVADLHGRMDKRRADLTNLELFVPFCQQLEAAGFGISV
jgi:hypothetical protein